MGKIIGWTKGFEGKKIINYHSDFDKNKRIEITSEIIDRNPKWFVYLVTKNKISDFPHGVGVTKAQAQKMAVDYMRKHPRG